MELGRTFMEESILTTAQPNRYINERQPISPSRFKFNSRTGQGSMEGLIPFLIHVMKKQSAHSDKNHSHRRSLSHDSERSYHKLLGSNSFSGSFHRRTRSEFQTPTSEFQTGLVELEGFTPIKSNSGQVHGKVRHDRKNM